MSSGVIDLAAPPQREYRPTTALSGAGQEGYTVHVDGGIFDEEDTNNALTGGTSMPAAGHSMGGLANAAPPATPRCRCRVPCELETSETASDYGRWADEPAEQSTLELSPVAAYQGGFQFNDPQDVGDEDVQAPKCHCGLQAVTKTSKSEKNPGREFWTCPRDRDEKCNFFQWIDAPATGGQQQPGGALGGSMQRQNEKPWTMDQGGPQQKRLKSAANEGIEGDMGKDVKCTCGGICVLLTSNSQKNPGRKFYKCPKPQGEQCRFFVWEDEMVLDQHGMLTGTTRGSGGFGGGGGFGGSGGGVGAGGSGGSNAGGVTKSGNCYICNEPGHWSSDCPQKSAGRGGGGYGRGLSYQAPGGGGGGGKSGNCYVCGEAGHWSSDCPQKSGRGRGGRGGRTFGTGSYGHGGFGGRGASRS